MEVLIFEIFIVFENVVDYCINFIGVVEVKLLLCIFDYLSKFIVWNGFCLLV